MKREGKVLSIDEDIAVVKLMKHAACGDCGACHIGDENMDIQIEAINKLGANIGDIVVIDMDDPNVLSAAFIAYGIPLISLIIGIFSGEYILELLNIHKNTEGYSLAIGIIFLFISYLYIKGNEKKYKVNPKYKSRITQIIK